MCVDCDGEFHRNKVASKHERVDVSEKPKAYGNCKIHTTSKLELFCNDCKDPICVMCKIHGNHSSGAFGDHPIVKISEAYEKTVGMSRESDDALEKRKNQIN